MSAPRCIIYVMLHGQPVKLHFHFFVSGNHNFLYIIFNYIAITVKNKQFRELFFYIECFVKFRLKKICFSQMYILCIMFSVFQPILQVC